MLMAGSEREVDFIVAVTACLLLLAGWFQRHLGRLLIPDRRGTGWGAGMAPNIARLCCALLLAGGWMHAQVIVTVAGNGTPDFSGDGGPAIGAALHLPTGVAVDTAGNLYIADRNNSRVRKVSSNGTIATVAGSGDYHFSGDGGPATSAGLDPWSVAV